MAGIQVNLTNKNSALEGVCFDPDELVLIGYYNSELSAHRARRLWQETFKNNFLLLPEADLNFQIDINLGSTRYILKCAFMSACARYAFWRIINYNAPEAQYVIETAHIPVCESRQDDIFRAPDLCSIYDDPSVLNPSKSKNSSIKSIFDKALSKFKLPKTY